MEEEWVSDSLELFHIFIFFKGLHFMWAELEVWSVHQCNSAKPIKELQLWPELVDISKPYQQNKFLLKPNTRKSESECFISPWREIVFFSQVLMFYEATLQLSTHSTQTNVMHISTLWAVHCLNGRLKMKFETVILEIVSWKCNWQCRSDLYHKQMWKRYVSL